MLFCFPEHCLRGIFNCSIFTFWITLGIRQKKQEMARRRKQPTIENGSVSHTFPPIIMQDPGFQDHQLLSLPMKPGFCGSEFFFASFIESVLSLCCNSPLKLSINSINNKSLTLVNTTTRSLVHVSVKTVYCTVKYYYY